MYSEEIPNQNPDVEVNGSTQEENSGSEKKTQKKSKTKEPTKKPVKKQINKAGKTEIINLLHDRPAKAKKKVSKVRAQPELQIKDAEKKSIQSLLQDLTDEEQVITQPELQIKDEEKKSIQNLLKDLAEEEQVSSKKEEVQTGPVIQIDAKERKKIISLLRDKAVEVEEPGLVEEVIDYEHMNKQELVELLEEVVEERDISKIKNQIARIKTAFYHCNKEEKDKEFQEFIASGGIAEEYKHIEDPLEQRFNSAFSKYRHNKARFAEELEKEKHHNLELKVQILEDLKELINSEETLKKTYDEFKTLQIRWKEIGMIPATELSNLWQNYHFLVERFFDKVRINKELRDLDLKKNLELKITLCEKTEDLLIEESIIKSFKLLQKYHDEWREIGPVPIDKKDEIWERFKTATDKINDIRKEHYKHIQEDQQNNYEAKLALCEKAEEVITVSTESLKDWQNKTDQINELFKVWKTIGRAPKAKNDEIWNQFKGLMDSFFGSKREFLNKLKEQQMNNLNVKIDLCIKAEAIKDNTEWRKTTQELIDMQKEWKRIGPVPRRHSDKVWKRFRSACDEFFNNKASFFKNIHVVEDQNLETKKKLVEEISKFKVGKDKDKNLDALKSFQRQWMDIGHVPMKEKDKIQQQYRKALDELLSKMDINKMELTKSEYKHKVEIMKNDPDASWKLSKERNNLSIKIKKLKEDLAVWENNIGFFASSAQSNVLKIEFEKKIEKARKEISSFETRLKILNGQ